MISRPGSPSGAGETSGATVDRGQRTREGRRLARRAELAPRAATRGHNWRNTVRHGHCSVRRRSHRVGATVTSPGHPRVRRRRRFARQPAERQKSNRGAQALTLAFRSPYGQDRDAISANVRCEYPSRLASATMRAAWAWRPVVVDARANIPAPAAAHRRRQTGLGGQPGATAVSSCEQAPPTLGRRRSHDMSERHRGDRLARNLVHPRRRSDTERSAMPSRSRIPGHRQLGRQQAVHDGLDDQPPPTTESERSPFRRAPGRDHRRTHGPTWHSLRPLADDRSM